jgi:hypothetical protein
MLKKARSLSADPPSLIKSNVELGTIALRDLPPPLYKEAKSF